MFQFHQRLEFSCFVVVVVYGLSFLTVCLLAGFFLWPINGKVCCASRPLALGCMCNRFVAVLRLPVAKATTINTSTCLAATNCGIHWPLLLLAISFHLALRKNLNLFRFFCVLNWILCSGLNDSKRKLFAQHVATFRFYFGILAQVVHWEKCCLRLGIHSQTLSSLHSFFLSIFHFHCEVIEAKVNWENFDIPLTISFLNSQNEAFI